MNWNVYPPNNEFGDNIVVFFFKEFVISIMTLTYTKALIYLILCYFSTAGHLFGPPRKPHGEIRI